MIIFKPDGQLDIATDAAALPEQIDQFVISSNALTRLKNLRFNQKGKLATRDGSVKINSTAINTPVWLLMEMLGNRYAFAGGNIYQNETSLASGLTNTQWSGIRYNSFNDTVQNIFALNGTDKKRIEGVTVFEWGHDVAAAPTTAIGPGTGLTGAYNAKSTCLRKVNSTFVS